MKVFCIKCKYLLAHQDHLFCDAEDNLEDFWLEEKGLRINKPDEINKNMDCKWFKEKELKNEEVSGV